MEVLAEGDGRFLRTNVDVAVEHYEHAREKVKMTQNAMRYNASTFASGS